MLARYSLVAAAVAMVIGSAPSAQAQQDPRDAPAPIWGTAQLGVSTAAAGGRVGAQTVGEWGVGIDVERRVLGRVRATPWVIGYELRAVGEIGSGSGGIKFFGPADVEVSVDYLLRIRADQGPFAGLALRAESFVAPSWIFAEVPRGEVGYQWQRADLSLRAYVFASYLVGSGAIDTVTRGTTTRPEFGARLFASVWRRSGAYATVDFHHVLGAGANSGVPVDEITGSACLVFVTPFTACARAAYYRGSTTAFAPSEAEWRVWSLDLVVALPPQRRRR